MTILRKLPVITVLFFCMAFFFSPVVDAVGEANTVVDAHVLEASPITEQEGLSMQRIQCEIVEGEFKGTIQEIQIFVEREFTRPLQEGDRIKVNVLDIEGELYLQFYDYSRSDGYIWLFGLFIIAFLVFVGWRGIQTLLPSIILFILIVIGILPDVLPQGVIILTSLFIVFLISVLTAWGRLRERSLTLIIAFSVATSVLIAFVIFVGFTQTSYVFPFLGTIVSSDDQVLYDVMDVLSASILFVPLGAVINSSTRIGRYLLKTFGETKEILLDQMLRKSLRISQKTAANEFNNLLITIVGLSLTGIFLVKSQYPEIHFWDNGWVALQVIYTISAGIAILLIAPVTAFVTALFFVISRRGGKSEKQASFPRKRVYTPMS